MMFPFIGRRGRHAAGLVLCAAVLFWLWRTAYERRVFGLRRLFVFFEDGAFLAVPALLLGLAVLFAAALLCADSGRRLCRRAAGLADRSWGRWLLAFGVTSLIVLWGMRVTVTSYMTNDDVFFLQAVVRVPDEGPGVLSGTFSHILFGRLLGALYALAPAAPWYVGYHLGLLFCSFVVLGRCILLRTRGNPGAVLWGCAAHFALCGGVFLAAWAQLSFTVTPAVAGSAAVALVLSRHALPTRRGRVASDIGCTVLMLLCYMQRSQTGMALLCFWGLAMAYAAVKRMGESGFQIRRFLGLGAAALSLLALIAALHRYTTANPYYDGSYWNAEYYRALVMDYLSGSLTYEHYAAAGIPRELATSLHGWFFMDKRVDTALFRALAEIWQSSAAGAGAAAGLAGLPAQLALQLREEPNMLYRALAGLCALLMAVCAFVRRGRRGWPELVCAAAAAGGALSMCLYLSYEGRIPLRAFLVPVLPACVTMLLMALCPADTMAAEGEEGGDAAVPAPDTGEETAPEVALSVRRGRLTRGAAVLSGGAFLVCCILSAHATPTAAEPLTRADLFSDQWTVEAYASARPEIVFVTNMYADNLDPFHSAVYPGNLVLWGAMGDTARPAEERLYADAFFREDVRFLCRNPAYVSFLLQYLTLDFGPVAAGVQDRLTDQIVVYALSRILPPDGGDGWYEWNGLRYYFRGGQALSGAQIVDGVPCEFGLPGADSPMTAVSLPEGTVYTTDAYRLLEGGAES